MANGFVRPMGVQPPDDRYVAVPCPECHGVGVSDGIAAGTAWSGRCPTCQGTGSLIAQSPRRDDRPIRTKHARLPRYGPTEHGIDRFAGGEYVKLADVLRLLEDG